MAGFYPNPNMYGAQNPYGVQGVQGVQNPNANWWYYAMLANNAAKTNEVSMTIVKLEDLEDVFDAQTLAEVKKLPFTPMGIKFPCGAVIPLPNPVNMNNSFNTMINDIASERQVSKAAVIKAMNARLAAKYYNNNKCSPFRTDAKENMKLCASVIDPDEIVAEINRGDRKGGSRPLAVQLDELVARRQGAQAEGGQAQGGQAQGAQGQGASGSGAAVIG